METWSSLDENALNIADGGEDHRFEQTSRNIDLMAEFGEFHASVLFSRMNL